MISRNTASNDGGGVCSNSVSSDSTSGSILKSVISGNTVSYCTSGGVLSKDEGNLVA
jgi:hypothetical protein